MGRKVKFDKKNSQKFHLLHRSQADTAYEGEGVPSDFVLFPADQTLQHRLDTSWTDLKPGKVDLKAVKRRVGDHITADGFLNDGYDYSQHLKEMGDGRFITKDGKQASLDYVKKNTYDLPDELFGSDTLLERDLEAITINPDVMDDDLRAALFDEADEEGTFEELDDDFILQIKDEPTEPDFDFDAHIAKLIARSEDSLQVRKPRGWGNEKAVMEDLEEFDEDFSDDDHNEGRIDESKQIIQEGDLNDLLKEYDDDELGDLVEVNEDDVDGLIDVEDDNEELENAIQDYLKEHRDADWELALNPKKKIEKSSFEFNTPVLSVNEIDTKKEMKEQERLQLELRIELETAEEFNGNLAECQEYLRETKPEEQWDCETILTTYSTLDNHPTVIKDTNSKFRPYKSRYERYKEKEEERNANRLVKQQSEQKKKIVLTGKYGLPEGYGKSAATGKSRSKEESKAKIVKSCETVEEKDTEEDGDEDAEDEGSDESKNSDSYEDSVSTSIVKRKSQESKEAKKLRKAEVKKERQEKRSAKKEMKLAFSNEGKKMKKVLANEQSIDRVSVFKY